MLAAILLSLSALSLASTNDYIWTTGAAPYRITGYGSGSAATNCIDRGEDVAFLVECSRERRWAAQAAWAARHEAITGIYGCAPFPGLFPDGHDLTYVFLDSSYANPYMATNAIASGGFVHDDAILISSPKDIGNQSDGESIAGHVFAGPVPYARAWNYRSSHGWRAPIAATSIFAVYKDFHDNDGITFRQAQRCNGTAYRWRHKEEHRYVQAADASHYTTAYTNSSYTTTGTNLAESVTEGLYRERVTILKRTDAMYDAGALIASETGYDVDDTEGWNKGLDGHHIHFHSYFSNRISRISSVAACRVKRAKRIRYGTASGSSTVTDIVVTNTVVLAPVQTTFRGFADDGGPVYSIKTDVPELSNAIIDFLGVLHPSEDLYHTFQSLPYPDPLPARHPDIWHQTYNSNDVEDSIDVKIIGIYGILKMQFNARELRIN